MELARNIFAAFGLLVFVASLLLFTGLTVFFQHTGKLDKPEPKSPPDPQLIRSDVATPSMD